MAARAENLRSRLFIVSSKQNHGMTAEMPGNFICLTRRHLENIIKPIRPAAHIESHVYAIHECALIGDRFAYNESNLGEIFALSALW